MKVHDVGINTYSLRFSEPEMENSFRHGHAVSSIIPLRSISLLIIVILAVLSARDLLFLKIYQFEWYYEYASLLTVMLFMYLHSYVENFKKSYHYDVAIICIFIEVNEAYYLFHHPEYTTLSTAPTIILIFAVYIVFRLLLLQSLGIAIAATLVYEAALHFSPAASAAPVIRQSSFVIIANIIGIAACYSIEYFSRKEFAAASELRRANNSLTETNKAKTEFIGIASHDLNNPLAIIDSLSSMLLTTEKLSEQGKKQLRNIHISSERMKNIIIDLMEVAEIETGIISLKYKKINCSNILTEVADYFRTAIELKQQRFQITRAENIMILADEEKLKAIFSNLISNAVKYSEPDSDIRIDLSVHQDVVRLVVDDDGPGLTEEDQSRLFKKWQRLSAKPTGGETSTGLGLSIVKYFVELHFGRVWAESAGRGKGSKFIVELPMK